MKEPRALCLPTPTLQVVAYAQDPGALASDFVDDLATVVWCCLPPNLFSGHGLSEQETPLLGFPDTGT